MAISTAVNAETLLARMRAAGISFPYSLTVALFGGTAPCIGTLFKDLGMLSSSPCTWPSCVLVSPAVQLRLPEAAHRPLER